MWWSLVCYGCLLVLLTTPSTISETASSSISSTSSSATNPSVSNSRYIANMLMFGNYSEESLRLALSTSPGSNSLLAQAKAIPGYLRKLVGSNCILIERGEVPPYYSCVGCVIEEGMGCVQDMRLNKSGNVHTKCKMSSASEKYAQQCCPKVDKDLQYRGAAYPMALHCLEQVGCKDTTLYSQLYDECQTTCPFVDARDKKSPICLAGFNAANANISMNWILSLTAMVSLVYYWVILV